MSINLTDELLAKTKKGKIASAKQVFLEGDQENLQQIGEKTHQLEDAIKDISVSGGASTANAVSYNNKTSGMTAVTAQGAIDELATKNKAQDAIIEAKADKSEVATELDKKFDKENIAQEFGDSKNKVVSQFALPFREIEYPEFIKVIVDAEDHFLFGIQSDGSIEWYKGIPAPIRTKLQEIINQCQKDKIDLTEALNSIESDLPSIKARLKLDLKGKSVSILGDSLSTFKGYIPEDNYQYYPNSINDVTTVEQTWWMQFINSSNTILDTNNSSAGGKVSGDHIMAYTKRINFVGSPDFLFIHGGTNDYWQDVPVGSLHFELEDSQLNIAEFADSYDLLIRKALVLYPNTNIILIIPNVSEEYALIIKQIFQKYKLFACVDLRLCKFTLAFNHYQVNDMEIVCKAIIDEVYIHKDVVWQKGMSLVSDDIASRFRVIENEEFIKAVVDSDDKVLFGFYRETGKPYYPQNDMYHISQNEEFLWVILDAANHPLLGIQQDGTCWTAKAHWLDDIKAIKEALSSIDETLKSFQPKEDGKGLINLDVADSLFYISNDEYIIAIVDAENRILAGIKYNGKPYFPNHEMYSVISNDEWLYAIIDAEDKVLGGFRADDGHMVIGGIDISTFIINAIIDIADIKERTNQLSTIENNEYLAVETDAEGKVIGYITPDGSHYLYKVKSETIDAKVDKEENKSLIEKDVADSHSTLEDPEERMEITKDFEDRIIGYRDSSGKRFENSMQIDHIFQNGKELNIAQKEDIESISLAKLDGVIDYSQENLFNKNEIKTYDSDFATRVYNAIGRNTTEIGCYSNDIPCKEGDWFTRNDFGTGIVVVLDKNKNIIGDVKNVAYQPTFQIKASDGQDFSEVAYVVMVVMLSNINSQKIVKAKYVTNKTEETLRIPKLKIEQSNVDLDLITYIKGKSGKYYSLSVDDTTSNLQIQAIQLEGIPQSLLPADFPHFEISGDFSQYYKSLVMCPIEGGETYLFELGSNGMILRYLHKKINCPRVLNINGVQYYYGVDGQLNSSSGKLNIYKAKEETFELVKGDITDSEGQLIEPHDCLVLSVNPLHFICQRYVPEQTTIVDGENKIVKSLHVEEIYDGKRVWLWKSEDYPDLWKDSAARGENADYLHNNTIHIDTDGNLNLNNKHADQMLIIERTWDESTHTGTIGDILWKVGGYRGEGFNYYVDSRIQTTTEQQWHECHDVVADKNGLYTLFDNRSTAPSRIIEFNVDKVNKKLTNFKAYTHKDSYGGRYQGSVDRCADGIYLVSWGGVRYNNAPQVGLYDFKNKKNIFELRFNNSASTCYRVYGIKK